MDQRLLEHYERELRHLRELGGEFAQQFPKIAGRLGLNAFECADPYVERLLEGCALLAARVQLKMSAEFPQFTEQILQLVCPHLVAPTPSLAVVQFCPSQTRQSALSSGARVERGTLLHSSSRVADTPVTYRTGSDVVLWPIELAYVRHTSGLSDLGPLAGAAAARGVSTLRLGLRATNGLPLSELAMADLPIFLRAQDARAMSLYELLVGSTVGAVLRPAKGAPVQCVDGRAEPMGLEPEDALLPAHPNAFSGYRLLHEYFALPSRFLFVRLSGLRDALRSCAAQEAELAVVLSQRDSRLEGSIAVDEVALYCAPAINLFERQADRIPFSNRNHEFQVIVDRTRPLVHEVHSVLSVDGFGSGGESRRQFRSTFESTDRSADAGSDRWYSSARRERRRSQAELERGPRSSYAGSEVFLSVSCSPAEQAQLRQLAVRVLCTNRDLPLGLPLGEATTDFEADAAAPLDSVRCVAGPSRPHPPLARSAHQWQLINHLSLNYLSLSNSDGNQGARALRLLLSLFSEVADPGLARQVDGVRGVSVEAILRRLPMPGPVTVGRGLRVALELEDAAFEGGGVFLFATVLSRFFRGYTSINSFVETQASTPRRGNVAIWPALVGARPVF